MKTNPHNFFHLKGENEKSRLRNFLIFVLLIVFITIIIILLTRGKTEIVGNHYASEQVSSLVCKKKGEKYPKINNTDSDNKEISVTALFSDKLGLKNIYFVYTLVYGSNEEAIHGEALGHFEFGANLHNLKFSEFDNKFSIIDNKFIVSLYGEKTDIEDEFRASYFMLDSEVKAGKDLNSITEMRNAFERKGFSCETSIYNSK